MGYSLVLTITYIDLKLRFAVDAPLNANQPNQMKTVPNPTRKGL